MTDYFSNLPVELIHKILDEIPSYDILTHLCLVNKRLHFVSLSYPRFQLDFSYSRKKRDFDVFCSQLSSISSQIISISFVDENDYTTSNKIDYFFSQFNEIYYTFPNLCSLVFSHIDCDMWETIKNPVKSLLSLTSLSVDFIDIRFIKHEKKYVLHLLNDLLFISSSLKYLCLRMYDLYDISDFNPGEGQISSIKHLILGNIWVNLNHIYSIAPALCTLDAIIDSYQLNYTKEIFRPECLKQLSIKFLGHFNVSTMEKLLYEMTRLVHLMLISIDVFNDVVDGFSWERILTNIMTFRFSFCFHQSTWTEEPLELDSFNTPFWIEEKRWYCQYDRCTVSRFLVFYSIPYFQKIYPSEYIKGPIITKSTGPKALSFCNINHLSITELCPINTEILSRFTNLQHLHIQYTENSFDALINNIISYIDMSKIRTFYITPCRSKLNVDVFLRLLSNMSGLRSFGASIALVKLLFVYRWPNITRLRIQYSSPFADAAEEQLTSDEIDTFYHSFSHLENIHFYRDIIPNLVKFLNNMPISVFSIVINHAFDIITRTCEELITRDWFEQNTQLCNFSYSCDEHGHVNLWF